MLTTSQVLKAKCRSAHPGPKGQGPGGSRDGIHVQAQRTQPEARALKQEVKLLIAH